MVSKTVRYIGDDVVCTQCLKTHPEIELTEEFDRFGFYIK